MKNLIILIAIYAGLCLQAVTLPSLHNQTVAALMVSGIDLLWNNQALHLFKTLLLEVFGSSAINSLPTTYTMVLPALVALARTCFLKALLMDLKSIWTGVVRYNHRHSRHHDESVPTNVGTERW